MLYTTMVNQIALVNETANYSPLGSSETFLHKSLIVSNHFVYAKVTFGYTLMPRDFTRPEKTVKKMFACPKYFESIMVPFGYTFVQHFLNIMTFLSILVTIHGRKL